MRNRTAIRKPKVNQLAKIQPNKQISRNMGFRYLTGLASSLMQYDIALSFGDDNEFGEPTIYVFTVDLKLGLSCHRNLRELVFYLHDFTTDKIYFGGEIKSTKTMMREFDRFILGHHQNDRANNPFFQKSEI